MVSRAGVGSLWESLDVEEDDSYESEDSVYAVETLGESVKGSSLSLPSDNLEDEFNDGEPGLNCEEYEQGLEVARHVGVLIADCSWRYESNWISLWVGIRLGPAYVVGFVAQRVVCVDDGGDKETHEGGS